MNNKGWGLNTMIILCVVLLGAFLISIILISTMFGFDWKNNSSSSQIDKTRTYNSMELEMVNASKKYINHHYNNEIGDEPLHIRVISLQNDKFLGNLYDVKDAGIECSGYVKIYKQEDIIRYEPYLKCGSNYVTEGYISKWDKRN